MFRVTTIAMACGMAFTTNVLANAGPPPLPKEHRVTQPSVRFEGSNKLDDCVVCLRVNVLYRGPRIIEIKDANFIKLDLGFTTRTPVITEMDLLAMERKEFERRKKDDPTLIWLTARTDGVQAVKLDPPAGTVPIHVKQDPETTYRIKRVDGKLSAEKVDARKPDPSKPSSQLPAWTFALACSLSLTWLGLWYARRRL